MAPPQICISALLSSPAAFIYSKCIAQDITQMNNTKLSVKNRSQSGKTTMVGCRSNGNVVFAEEQMIQSGGAVSFENLPDSEFEIAISIENGVSDGESFVNDPNLETIIVELFDDRIDFTRETSESSQKPTVEPTSPQQGVNNQQQANPSQSPTQNQQQGQSPTHNQQQGQPPAHNQQQGQPPAHNQQQGQPPAHNQQQGQPPAHNQQQGQPPAHNQQQGQPPAQNQQQGSQQSLSADEQFCHSCGEVIKDEASMCPNCGVSTGNSSSPHGSGDLPTGRKRELQKIARKSPGTLMIVTFLWPSAGYVMVDEIGWAAICFLTGHYGLLGYIVAPFHVKGFVTNARQELETHGETW